MSVIVLLILAGGAVAGGFLAAFAWAVRAGQFDDITSPPIRVLFEDAKPTQTTTPDMTSRKSPHAHHAR